MIIYIVAGERNCRKGAVSDNGGLWANVGQTSRNPEDRLTDDDYRKKAAGGKWLVLAQFDVGDSLTDYDVHKYLKSHPEIKYDYSSNTEEFLFTTDDGSGRRAKEIVGEFVEVNCIPMLQNKVIELQQVIEELQVSRIEAENKLKHYMETDDGKLKAECFSLLEKANEEYFLKLEELDAERQKVKDILKLRQSQLDAEKEKVKDILKLRQSQLDTEEQKVLNHWKEIEKRESLIFQAEAQRKQTEAKLREREFFLEEQHNKRETKINFGYIATAAFLSFMITKCSSEDAGQYKKQLRSQDGSYQIQLANKDEEIKQLQEKLLEESKQATSLKNIVEEKAKLISILNDNIKTLTAEKHTGNKPVKVRVVKQMVEVPKIVEKVKVVEVPAPAPVPQPVVSTGSYYRPTTQADKMSTCMQSCKAEKKLCYQAVTDGKLYKNDFRLGSQYACNNHYERCESNCKVQYGDD